MAFTYAGQYTEAILATGSGGATLLPALSVNVYTVGTTTPVTLYTSRTKAAGTNPVTTDVNGNLTFYAIPGQYDVVFTPTGGSQKRITVTVPVDPAEAATSYQPIHAPSAARRVIWATDWYSDVDDPIAARALLYYERIGTFDVLAAICNTATPDSAPSMDAFFRSHGRPMQIGQIPYSGTDLTTPGPYQANMAASNPHAGAHASQFPDSTTVHRMALAASPDGSVEIISTGYLNGLSLLLQSPGDAIDSRTGLQLVTAKVSRLWCMGGNWPTGSENNFNRSTSTKTAANYVVANWPTPITFCGFEVGSTVIVGSNLAQQAPTSDILVRALFDHGSPNGRAGWDPLTVVLAANGATAAGYTTAQGTAAVDASTGANTWTTGAGGPHQYVVKNKTDAAFVADVDPLLIPGFDSIPATAPYRDKPKPSLAFITGTTQVDALPVLARMKVTDNIWTPDGSLVPWLPSHAGGGPSWVQATSGLRPTYRANIGGRACLDFGGAQRIIAAGSITFPAAYTVLARVRWAVLPTTNQSVTGADDAPRLFHLKGIAGSIVQAVDFSAGTGQSDNSAASLVANTWHLIALRVNGTTLEALIDGASNGATTTAGAANTGVGTIAIGARSQSGTEEMTGYVADVKVVSGFASDAQVTALSADM